MASVNSFRILLGGKITSISLVDISSAYLFTDYGSDENTQAFTQRFPPGKGGTNIITLFKSVLQAAADEYLEQNPTGVYQSSAIPVLREDGTTDPYRSIYVRVRNRTNPKKPSDFASMADTPLRVDDNVINIPGDLIQEPAWGVTIQTWTVYMLYGSYPSLSNGLSWSDALNVNLNYKDTGGYTSALSTTYWPVQNMRCCIISHEGDAGNYTTIAGVDFPIQSFAPGYPGTIYGYYYLRNDYTPRPGYSNNYPYLFLHGNEAYGSSPVVPALGQLPLDVPSDTSTPSGGTSQGGNKPPTTDATPDITDETTGFLPSDVLDTVRPDATGTTIPVGDGGEVTDTFGTGIAAAGETVNGGYITVSMTMTELMRVFERLFSNNPVQSAVDHLKNLFGDPLSAIITAKIFPFGITGTGVTLYVGGQELSTGSRINSQFVGLELGSVKVPILWGRALDYVNTKVSIYLPYVGWQGLATSDVMGRTLTLHYNVDVISGSFVAILNVSGKNADGSSFSADMYQWSGSMGMDIPLTSAGNYDIAVTTALMGVGSSLAGGAAGMTAKTFGAGGTGAALTAAGKMYQSGATGKSIVKGLDAIPQGPHSMGELIGALQEPPPSISRGGSATGSAGYLGGMTPCLLIDRPVTAMPENYSKLVGWPCGVTYKLGDLSGYTEVATWEPNIAGATTDELRELDEIVKGGFWI